MDVYLIELDLTISNTDTIEKSFFDTLKEKLEEYITITIVTKNKIVNLYNHLQEDTIVILFNGDINDNQVEKNLKRAKEVNAQILPVAFDKETRKPIACLRDVQSYDVYEQLRRRNLSTEYISLIANVFARMVVSKVMPTIYSSKSQLFISHKRSDGEEIAARLCDKLQQQAHDNKVFRDLTDVKVGDKAQEIIDKAMLNSDVFIFLHTPESVKSDWIKKELSFAVLRHIPIIWVRIDDASITDIKIFPLEKANLSYSSEDFSNETKLTKIADEILEEAFRVSMLKMSNVYTFKNAYMELFKDKFQKIDDIKLMYKIQIPRKGYHYPQRDIVQYVQLYGKNPCEEEIKKCYENIKASTNDQFDNFVVLSDKYLKKELYKQLVRDSYEDFYFQWNTYLNKGKIHQGKEIIISGAFPDADEIYKQNLTDGLIVFAKVILKSGYKLTFGSHPTFQETFFEIARDIIGKDSNKFINMFISKWFEDKYFDQKEYFKANAELHESSKKNSLNESLTQMRVEMIKRNNVAALVCLGGKIKDNKNEEGVREEIKIAREFGIPVFVVGSVGGCSSKVASEYKLKWHELNAASVELNKKFMYDPDYFGLANDMLKFLG